MSDSGLTVRKIMRGTNELMSTFTHGSVPIFIYRTIPTQTICMEDMIANGFRSLPPNADDHEGFVNQLPEVLRNDMRAIVMRAIVKEE
jgi:hypothetical protein